MPAPTRPSLIIRLTHSGQYADGRTNTSPVQIPDLDVGYERQDRKVPVYVPVAGSIDINASSRSMLSYEQGGIQKFTNAGLIFSRMFWVPESFTTAGLPSATGYPVGTFVWNTDDGTAYWSNGTSWVAGSRPVGPASGDLNGSYPAPTVVRVQNIPWQNGTPNNGDAALYNSFTNQWEHAPITFSGGPPTGPASNDLGGLYPGPVVVGLQQDLLPAKVANGFLKRNAPNTAWEEVGYGSTVNTVCQGNDPRLSDSRPPSGVASGDLSGNYPAPTVDGLQGRPVADTAPTVDAALAWNGTAWSPQAGGTPSGAYPVVTITANHTASAWQVVLANTAAGNLTVTLPSAASCVGKPINIKKISPDGYKLTVAPLTGQTIDGQTNQVVTDQFNCMTVVSDGSNWWII